MGQQLMRNISQAAIGTSLHTGVHASQTVRTIPRIVTTSWDDGDLADLRLAELLRSRGVRGTFYVPVSPYNGQPSLGPPQLRSLSSEGFEIGAHGVSHKLLWGLPEEELSREISPCKPMLEDILGSEVGMFCYPRGRYDRKAVLALKQAGYRGARTVRMFSTCLDFNPFEMPTSLQVFPHSRFSYIRNVLRARMKGLHLCLSHLSKLESWLELGKSLFDSVLEDGGVWHLYGHSWEIDQLGLWDTLEELMTYVSRRQGVTYVTNGQVLRFVPGARS
jgi:peptidoglycan-N-acetylglucosamine deacetylase